MVVRSGHFKKCLALTVLFTGPYAVPCGQGGALHDVLVGFCHQSHPAT